MDDDKKDNAVEWEIAALITFLVIVAALPVLSSDVRQALVTYATYIDVDKLSRYAKSAEGFLVGLSLPISVFFLVGIIYCIERLKIIREKERTMYDLPVEPAMESVEIGDQGMANRWKKVIEHMSSSSPSDWKQGILEADIILDDLLTKMGYRGETVGEKLQRVATGDFQSLADAWEAHKVRNKIAHDGSAFQLNEHEAKEAFNRYKKVFEEFYYV